VLLDIPTSVRYFRCGQALSKLSKDKEAALMFHQGSLISQDDLTVKKELDQLSKYSATFLSPNNSRFHHIKYTIEEFFAEKISDLPIRITADKTLFDQQHSDTNINRVLKHSRAVFAIRDIKKGEIVFSETPQLCLQCIFIT
jgi:hypothetical protein